MSRKNVFDEIMKKEIEKLSKADYSVHSIFDPIKHNKNFINCCEVIIDKEGIIRYATPSHNYLLQAIFGVEQGLLNDSTLDSTSIYMRMDVGIVETIQNYLDEYQAPTGIDYFDIMMKDT